MLVSRAAWLLVACGSLLLLHSVVGVGPGVSHFNHHAYLMLHEPDYLKSLSSIYAAVYAGS
jgi:hypothetical protein